MVTTFFVVPYIYIVRTPNPTYLKEKIKKKKKSKIPLALMIPFEISITEFSNLLTHFFFFFC